VDRYVPPVHLNWNKSAERLLRFGAAKRSLRASPPMNCFTATARILIAAKKVVMEKRGEMERRNPARSPKAMSRFIGREPNGRFVTDGHRPAQIDS